MSAYNLSIGNLRDIDYFSKNHIKIENMIMVEEDFYILKSQDKVYALSLLSNEIDSSINKEILDRLERTGSKISNEIAAGIIDDVYFYRLEDASGTISLTEYLRDNHGEKVNKIAKACADFFSNLHKLKGEDIRKNQSLWLDQIRDRLMMLSKKSKLENTRSIKALGSEYVFEDMIKEYFYYLDPNPTNLIYGNINTEKIRIDRNSDLIFFGFSKLQIGEYAYDLTFLAGIHLINPEFTRTFINQYFDNKVPKKFFKIFAVYTSLKILESLSNRDKMDSQNRKKIENSTQRILQQLSKIDNLSEFWEK